MTSKPIAILSMILIFAMGAFVLADEPTVNEDAREQVPTATTSTEMDATPEMYQEPTPSYEIEYHEDYCPEPGQDQDNNDQKRLRQMYYEGEYTKKASEGDQMQLVSETKAKQEKTEPKVTKESTPKQETTENKSPTEEVTVVEGSEFVEMSPAPVYSNRTYHGYSREQIRNMPMVARPDRPGHFFGNTVRAIYRTRHGR